MITASGFIVYTDEAIYGVGETVPEAVTDAQNNLDNHVDASELPWLPATAALIAEVKRNGGAVAWDTVNRIACAADEDQPTKEQRR